MSEQRAQSEAPLCSHNSDSIAVFHAHCKQATKALLHFLPLDRCCFAIFSHYGSSSAQQEAFSLHMGILYFLLEGKLHFLGSCTWQCHLWQPQAVTKYHVIFKSTWCALHSVAIYLKPAVICMWAGQCHTFLISHTCTVQTQSSTLALAFNDSPMRFTNTTWKYLTAKKEGDWEREVINVVLMNIYRNF